MRVRRVVVSSFFTALEWPITVRRPDGCFHLPRAPSKWSKSKVFQEKFHHFHFSTNHHETTSFLCEQNQFEHLPVLTQLQLSLLTLATKLLALYFTLLKNFNLNEIRWLSNLDLRALSFLHNPRRYLCSMVCQM